MSKYIIIGIVILGIVALFIVFKPNGKIFKSTKELELTYKMSAGIPFKRVIEIEDESIVELAKQYVSKDENTGGKVGAPVYMTYVFKGLKEGTTTISYKVVSIEEDSDVMNEEKTKVTVDKELNIKAVKEDE